jgi:hypothetical protein
LVVGVFLEEEEKVEQEIPGGPQAPSCEVLNPALQALVHIDPIE